MIAISDETHLRICRLVGECEVLGVESDRVEAGLDEEGETMFELRLLIVVRTMRQSRVKTLIVPAGEWRDDK